MLRGNVLLRHVVGTVVGGGQRWAQSSLGSSSGRSTPGCPQALCLPQELLASSPTWVLHPHHLIAITLPWKLSPEEYQFNSSLPPV